jgi:hypothetical protein
VQAEDWNQLVKRWEERDRRWEERDKRWEERDRRWEERDARLDRTIRETTERQVAVTQELIGTIARLNASLDDMRDQLRANTEATWRMLDRFGEGPATA